MKKLESMIPLIKEFTKQVQNDEKVIAAGKINPRRHIESEAQELMGSNILQCMSTMINVISF